MPYTLNHAYARSSGPCAVERQGRQAVVRYSHQGELPVRHPGLLKIETYANFRVQVTGARTQRDGATAGRAETSTTLHTLPLVCKIFTPDGREFTQPRVSLADLARFRNLHGVSQGVWTYEVSGQSGPVLVDPEPDPNAPAGEDEGLTFKRRIQDTHAAFNISLDETPPVLSPPPLVKAQPLPRGTVSTFSFDLFRLGELVAQVESAVPLSAWTGVLALKDPDGQTVASATGRQLRASITPPMLLKSRTAEGTPRPWTLTVAATGASFGATPVFTAQVFAQTRIATANLAERLAFLVGDNGNKLSLRGDMVTREVDGASVPMAVARLEILDAFSAETIDMHDLLDKAILASIQDPGVLVPDQRLAVQAHVPYVVAQRPAKLGSFTVPVIDLTLTPTLDVGPLRVRSIALSAGASVRIQPAVPALKLALAVEGAVLIRIMGVKVASVAVRGGKAEIEAGIGADAAGNLVARTSMPGSLLDIDVSTVALLSLGIASPLLALAVAGLTSYIEHEVNEALVKGFDQAVQQMLGAVPHTVARLLGGYFDVKPPRLEGNDIVFDYAAPLEPDPKPAPNYSGAIGRQVFSVMGDSVTFLPRLVKDTWATDNLKKIDHVVVVMMENRAFDHVLGYRARLPNAGLSGSADGLGGEMQQTMDAFKIGLLRNANLPRNALNLATRFPQSVGHHTVDVAQQLAKQLTLPSGRSINSPEGFMANFRPGSGLKPEDVLGYYDGADLPFYKYLADNYAYCERYYCSHPGPTLPNRMYALAGDLQFDRTGEAIVDNNSGDNLIFSRAMTVFDLLSRYAVPWRVYESNPSVAMLRLFARYTTDLTNIVPISRLRQDVLNKQLPAFTVIEPAMHHAPQNDDHPTADMYDGQLFLQGVYDALTANPEVWQKTMLLITYDEHGGFYDHVVPPLADVRTASAVLSNNPADPNPPANNARTTLYTPYGVRVPTFVVSPWVPAGKGPDTTLDHCSILKTVIARFCGRKAFLSDRVAASNSFESFLSAATPRMATVPPLAKLPALPRPSVVAASGIATRPINRAQIDDGSADFHEITGMVARLIGRR